MHDPARLDGVGALGPLPRAMGHAVFCQTGRVPSLGEPPRLGSPLFVYGLLKPGELAYRLIVEYVSEKNPAVIRGCLRLRDGLPLLERVGTSEVQGYVLHFDPMSIDEAWRAVADFVPGRQCKYETVDVDLAGENVPTNVLVGRQIDCGTSPESTDRWSACLDPVFVEGLAEVFAMTIETAPGGVAR